MSDPILSVNIRYGFVTSSQVQVQRLVMALQAADPGCFVVFHLTICTQIIIITKQRHTHKIHSQFVLMHLSGQIFFLNKQSEARKRKTTLRQILLYRFEVKSSPAERWSKHSQPKRSCRKEKPRKRNHHLGKRNKIRQEVLQTVS